MIKEEIALLNKFFFLRAPVAQSVVTGVVNPGVVGSNPSSASIFSDIWQKSLRHFIFHKWANSLCGKAASCLKSMLCEVTGVSKTRKHMSRWTGRCDMTENVLITVVNPNQSIKKKSQGWSFTIFQIIENYLEHLLLWH